MQDLSQPVLYYHPKYEYMIIRRHDKEHKVLLLFISILFPQPAAEFKVGY
jgi:hypothetical protein